MKQFFKYVLATIVGMIIMSIIGIVIMFGMIGAMTLTADTPVKLKAQSVYELNINGTLLERYQEDPMSEIVGQMYGVENSLIGLDEILYNIRKAKTNDKIAGIYLKAGGYLSSGFASLKEIRDALEDFKQSGKFIVAYGDNYSQGQYYLCSVADKVIANPQGMVEWQGLATQTPFLKGLLNKMGIEMQVLRVGTFKSAVEPFTDDKMSEANRQQVTIFTNSIWNTIVRQVSESREIASDSLNFFADKMLALMPASEVLAYRMIDTITYADGVDGIINKFLGNAADAKVKYVGHSKMTLVPSTKKLQKERIAVLYASGEIMDASQSSVDNITFEQMNKAIEQIAKDDAIKAVVFRVNSPGGSAFASEQIWRAVSELKAKKPVIVSMGDYAASGGYYISCDADCIVAQPNTLTGSIGIFGLIPNFEGLTKKIGVTFDGVKTNQHSDMISFNRPFTPEERNLLQAYIERGYETFVSRCAEGRNISVDSIKQIAEGRVWTGEDALKIGLVDELGNLQRAIEIAAQKVNLEEYSIVSYPEKLPLFARIMQGLSGEDVKAKIAREYFGNEGFNLIKNLKSAENQSFMQARMEYDIVIK
ncbi:MAG: signal peptide peptidase SppA [Prevotellaceae bacterium]|jgi:protease-4|nr:signal peptide peptidase SppA [Prevotellaceae bacterium]